MKPASVAAVPLSRVVALADLTDRPARFRIAAGPEERKALADELGILSVERADADVDLQLLGGAATAIRLTGHVTAEVTQACVVTLEPVRERIDAAFQRNYVMDHVEETSEEIDLSSDVEEPAEPVSGGVIDIGVAVTEQLALELNPFPRAPGVVFEGFSAGEGEEPKRQNPFAALAALKGRDGSGSG